MGLKNNSLTRADKVYWLLALLLAATYFIIVGINTLNIPENDDFGMLQFLNQWIETDSITEKFNLVFSGNGIGSHTAVPMKVILLLSYYIFGTVNFTGLIILSNLFLLGIVFLFFKFFSTGKQSLMPQNTALMFFCLICVILNGQNFETSVWAMVGLANVGTILWIMLAAFFTLHKEKKFFWIGVLFTAISVFSNGNGFFLYPILLLLLLLLKRKKQALLFVILGGIAVAGYIFINRVGFAVEYKTQSTINLSYKINVDTILSFFNFVGCSFYISSSIRYISTILGIAIVSIYLFSIYKKSYLSSPAWFGFFSFMLLTAASVALNRGSDGMGDARFRIYGSIFLALAILFFIENRENLKIKNTIIVLGVSLLFLFGILSDLLCYQRVENLSQNKLSSSYLWKKVQTGLVLNLGGEEPKAAILKKSEALKIYTMPNIPLKSMSSDIKPSRLTPATSNDKISYGIDSIFNEKEYTVIWGWAYSETMSMPFTEISLSLVDSIKSFNISTFYQIRPDVIQDRNKKQCGFFAVIPKNKIKQGRYTLGIEIKKRYIVSIKKSVQSIMTGVKVDF